MGQGFALVQSYIEARSLQQWAEEGRTFSEEEVKAIATQLLEILDYLHNRQPQVIHRDIKPSNILLGDRSGNSIGQVYLVDFGSVQTVKQDGTLTIVGTYGYMPPEQFAGRTTPASDLYSLGATLSYLLSGCHPADLLIKYECLKIDPNLLTDRHFSIWLKRIIEANSRNRFISSREALKALQSNVLGTSKEIQKPKHSRVSIAKTNDHLNIYISSLIPLKSSVYLWKTIGNLVGYLVMFMPIAYLLYLNTFLLVSRSSVIAVDSIGYLIVTIVFLILAYFMYFLLRECLDLSIGRTSININLNEVEVRHELLWHTKRYSFKTHDVNQIVHVIPEFNNKMSRKSEAIFRKYEIIYIKTDQGIRKTLGINSGSLTRHEYFWLAQEISDWLDIPIMKSRYIEIISEQESKLIYNNDESNKNN